MGYRNAPGEPGRPSREQGPGHRRFGALCREERGQSLVVIVIAMTLIVLVAAVAIDVSDWFAKHHQAQVTADAAALAAANYMGHGGSTGSATSTATTYASDNGLAISNSNVTIDTTSSTATVTVPTTGPLFFAGISLGSGPSISARAVASWKIRDCSSAGAGCLFAFAGDNVCSGTTGVTATLGNNTTAPVGHGLTFNDNGASQRVTGNVESASNIDTSGINRNNTWSSAALYSSGGSCYGPLQGNPYIDPFTAASQNAVDNTWPIDYSQIYAACAGSTCWGNGYPKYCTPSGENVTSVTSIATNTVYCNAGTGNVEDPSTWNGVINVNSGGNATFIAGQVNFTVPNNAALGPAAGTNLLAYAADCNAVLPTTCPASVTQGITSPAISLSTAANGSGQTPVSGDLFAPAGVIDSNLGGTPTVKGFLEGWDIAYNVNGTVLGEGPQTNNSLQFVGDYLIQ